MSTALALFTFDHIEIRVQVDEQGAPWFVASDLARMLEYRMASDMTRLLPDDEKGTRPVRTPGGEQAMSVISEPGLYRAVFRASTVRAEPFRRWVTREVLPAIRKTGGYALQAGARPVPTTFSGALRLAAELQEQVEQQQEQLAAQAPKVAAHDRYLDAAGTMSLRDAAKVLGMREHAFISQLLQDGILFRTPGENGRLRAYADQEKAGRFVHRAGTAKESQKAFTQVRVTPEGVDWLSRRYSRPALQAGDGAPA